MMGRRSKVKAKTSEVKAKTSEVKAKSTEVKAKTSEVKARSTEVKAKTSEVKAKSTEVSVTKAQAEVKAMKLLNYLREENREIDLQTKLLTDKKKVYENAFRLMAKKERYESLMEDHSKAKIEELEKESAEYVRRIAIVDEMRRKIDEGYRMLNDEEAQKALQKKMYDQELAKIKEDGAKKEAKLLAKLASLEKQAEWYRKRLRGVASVQKKSEDVGGGPSHEEDAVSIVDENQTASFFEGASDTESDSD